MGEPDRERSPVEHNRMAAMIVVGSLLVAIGVSLLYWYGWLEYIIPAHGPAADAAPLYVLVAVVFLVLVVWSWGRLLSWFE